MNWFTIILIAVGLAMDCFAVSIAQGLSAQQRIERPRPVLMALLFGLFQGGMPLIGYFAGSVFANFFKVHAPWIALVLLAFIGGKMIWESFQETKKKAGWRWAYLLMLAVATSIDALATGVIFIPVPEKVWIGIAIIGLVSFVFSIAGFIIGKRIGKRFHVNMELIGGLVLIGIGIKICLEGVL